MPSVYLLTMTTPEDLTVPDPDLTVPPSEIELAQLLAAVSAALGPSAALVLRRLACERDRLRAAQAADFINRHVEQSLASRNAMLEALGKGFVAATGLDPREAELVEEHKGVSIHWHFRKRTNP